MTFKNQAEIYQALLGGKKLKLIYLEGFIHLDNGMLVDDMGVPFISNFTNIGDWSIYEEPKKKVKLYKYAIYNKSKSVWSETLDFYSNDDCRWLDDTKYIKLENNYIEVDDE